MEINSVALIGAGAVGCYLIRALSQKPSVDLMVVADGERKKRFETEGFLINSETYRPKVVTPEQARGADLIIVAVKYNSLRPALADIRTVADDHSVVMSLMNGVDSEEIIGEVIPKEQILHALIKVASERNGNSVKFDPETTIGMIFGEVDPGRSAERTDALVRLFEGTDLHYRVTDCILSEIWSKFLLNVGNNQPQAMVGCGVGAYRDSEHMAFFRDNLRAEVIAIAEAKGIDLSKAAGSSKAGSKVADRARYSTLQDLDAHRHTEVDMFALTVVRMGREMGIPTPCNEFTYHMIKALEEKNDGLFDYE